jgi:hypothetical protein
MQKPPVSWMDKETNRRRREMYPLQEIVLGEAQEERQDEQQYEKQDEAAEPITGCEVLEEPRSFFGQDKRMDNRAKKIHFTTTIPEYPETNTDGVAYIIRYPKGLSVDDLLRQHKEVSPIPVLG